MDVWCRLLIHVVVYGTPSCGSSRYFPQEAIAAHCAVVRKRLYLANSGSVDPRAVTEPLQRSPVNLRGLDFGGPSDNLFSEPLFKTHTYCPAYLPLFSSPCESKNLAA